MDGRPRSAEAVSATRWSRRKVLGLAAAAGGTLVAPLPALPAGARTAASRAGTTTNPVVTWDENAQTAIWDVAVQQPNEQVRSFAMVSGAVYDAVNAIAGMPYEPYLLRPSRRRGGSSDAATDAAIATAGHTVLAALFPNQQARLQGQYEDFLAGIPDGPSKALGVAIGADAGGAMVAARQDDGAFGDQVWPEGTGAGEWRPTPPTFASSGAWTGFIDLFLVPNVQAFRSPGPPALASERYARDLAEVASVGSATSTTRTADQTQAAVFWHDRRSVNWEIKRQLAVTRGLSPLETARMFALVDMVVADSGTVCFREKHRWSFWRPITAIREAGADGNDATEPDPAWTPLLVTPPFPEYPSGHAAGTGSRMSAFAAFFGRDSIPFSSFSVDANATRRYTSFSQAVDEVIGARVWGGIHFRTADVDGIALGKAVTAYAVKHHFRRR